MTGDDEAYTAVIRQAAHDAVRALLSAPPDSMTGSQALRAVTTWLAAEHGTAAVIDLAEELAADLAEPSTRLPRPRAGPPWPSSTAGSTTSRRHRPPRHPN
jgi:hypothetical protein